MILDVPLYLSLLNSPKQKLLGKNPSRVSIDRLGSGTLTDTNIATENSTVGREDILLGRPIFRGDVSFGETQNIE